MVELFTTNVDEPALAEEVLRAVRRLYPCCRANFDLQDCDRLLRIECRQHAVSAAEMKRFLDQFNIEAEVLEDFVPVPH